MLIALFVFIFQCRPILASWHFELRAGPEAATCLQPGRIILGIEITNVLIDVLILSLPVYMIRKLQMRTIKKLCIASIFLLGGL